MREQIQQLIAEGRTEEALALVAKNNSDAILLQARYTNGKKQYNIGLMEFSEWSRIQNQVNYALLELADKASPATSYPSSGAGQGTPNGNTQGTGTPDGNVNAATGTGDGNAKTGTGDASHLDVFISYNHKDSEAVDKIKEFLEKNGLQVLIDREDMHAGENIQSFIERMMKGPGVILSVVSKNSLRSGWVGFEQDLSFYSGLFGGKKFIPVMLDYDFFEDDFVFDVIQTIDAEIAKMDKNIDKARQNNIDPLIYETKRRRQVELRENLPKIINRLQGVLTVDISDGNFENGLMKVVKTVKGGNGV